MNMEQLEEILGPNTLNLLQEVNGEGRGSLCVCCGTTVGYGANRKPSPQNHIITASVWTKDELPDAAEGFECFLIPDGKQSLFLEWANL